MTLPTKLPTGLQTASPTTSGWHNHVRPGEPDPARRAIDRVFGNDAPVICGLPIEVGHGALPMEAQLAEHVLRIFREDGDDTAWKTGDRLLVADGVKRGKFEDELVARNLLTRAQKKKAP